MHKTSVNIPADKRKKVIAMLNARLADAVDLGVQAKLAHWNVRGPTFMSLHELFDKVADMAFGHADILAERIAALGGVAHGTIQETAKNSHLPKYDVTLSDGKAVTAAVVRAIAAFTNNARDDIGRADKNGDLVTADTLTEISGEADKMLWFVEAHLQ